MNDNLEKRIINNDTEKRTEITKEPRKGIGHPNGNDPIVPVPKIDPNKPSVPLEQPKK